MIKSYLQLFRISGIFTSFSNILLGFFVSQGDSTNWLFFTPLLITTGFLFLAGMTLNDFFDYNIDRKERPNRPLASGKIQKNNALYLGIIFLGMANVSATFVGMQSVILSSIITVLIVAYNIKLKNLPVLGILNLSSIRTLNIVLGSTVVPFNQEIIIVSIPIAIFVAGISILAKTEILHSSRLTQILNVIFIFITISYIEIISYDTSNFIHIILLVLFMIAVFIPFQLYKKSHINIQKKVTFQLLAIIILDAVVISVFSDIYKTAAILSLYLPAYFLSTKTYLT